MNRTLRGARARRGTLLPLFLLTTVVVAGVVAVMGLAKGSGTSSAVGVPLLALGLVAVPTSGRQLAAIRRQEIAVARLRGVTGGQLAVTLAVEPFLVLVLGSLVGLAAGALVAAVAAGLWVGAELSLGVTVLPTVALIVVVGLAAVLVGMAGALREPLAEQVSVAERPRPASTAALFFSVLLLVAAVVVAYRSSVVDAKDPGWVVLAGPALVGLALGQLTVWVVRLLALAGVRWTARSHCPPSWPPGASPGRPRLPPRSGWSWPRRSSPGSPSPGPSRSGDWSEDTARMRAGAPYRISLADADVEEALGLTRELDPDGRWLMAAALVPDEGSVPARRAFLDMSRYDAVVGDFFADTPAAGVARRVVDLVPADAQRAATGTRWPPRSAGSAAAWTATCGPGSRSTTAARVSTMRRSPLRWTSRRPATRSAPSGGSRAVPAAASSRRSSCDGAPVTSGCPMSSPGSSSGGPICWPGHGSPRGAAGPVPPRARWRWTTA